jgi:hypothetical protein
MKTLRHLTRLIACVTSTWMSAATYHVWPGGDNTDGRSRATAFHTLQQAADAVEPGDTVLIGAGTYTNSTNVASALHPQKTAESEVLWITRGGTADAWIEFDAFPGEEPLIKFNGWGGIKIMGSAAYVVIRGLTIEGNNENVTLVEARIQETTHRPEARFSGNGISIDGRQSGAAKPHHIRIVGNTIRQCGGGGIACIQADYLTIEDNTVHACAWYAPFANSAISLYQNWNYDDDPGYRNVIARNRCYDNRSLVLWIYASTPKLSDGNGIIIDDSRNTQNNSELGRYRGRTLVANNLVFNNGGSGMHAYESDHVDFINNTAYHNGQIVGYPEISAGDSSDVRILRNIMSARPGGRCNSNHNNVDVIYDYNLYHNGTTAVRGGNDIEADPQFIAPHRFAELADFRLRGTSPARDSGGSVQDVPGGETDLLGQPRVHGREVDRGAIEFVPSGAPAPTAGPVELEPVHPGASPATKSLLNYLAGLPRRQDQRLLSGQFTGHGDEIVSDGPGGQWALYVETLHEQTGKYPALVSLDYEYAAIYTLDQLKTGNAKLKEHWRAGGLVTINYTARNPFTGGTTRDKNPPGRRLEHLVDPSHPDYAPWHARLDVIAEALRDLQEAGVVVLWRPLQENNGTWFWYSDDGYNAVYRDMFHYFHQKGLRNLIWIWSVAEFARNGVIWSRYPGNAYVDIVGANPYNLEVRMDTSYDPLRSTGKLFAMTENGWPIDGADGSNDNRKIVESIRTRYPETLWQMSWHDWKGVNRHALVSNRFVREYMSDPWVISRDGVDWRRGEREAP